jgi:GT2 family glycosyltransferase
VKEKQTICAVVVTYNRKDLLLECLDALLKQTYLLDGIYIIDNASIDGTPDELIRTGYITQQSVEQLKNAGEREFEILNIINVNGKYIKIHYVRMCKNTGGAGGFYEGVKRAYEKGYDWLWLMDDDAEPFNNTLAGLLSNLSNNKIYAICPLIVGSDNKIQFYHHKKINFLNHQSSVLKTKSLSQIDKNLLIKEDANAFVGPLIYKQVIEKIGFPKKELFIWGDDTEYTLRISKNFDLYVFTGSLIMHKDNNYALKDKLDKNQYWKVYFGIRNKIYISRKYIGYLSIFYIIIRTLLSCLKADIMLCKFKIKGLRDGFTLN